MEKITRRDAIRLSAVGVFPLGAHTVRAVDRASDNPGDAVYDVAFEGGGAKGCAFVGALEVLLADGANRRLGRVVGASAGAITATFLAAGYSPREMLAILKEEAKGEADPIHPRADGQDRPPRRMAQLMDWATLESVQDLVGESDTLKAFEEASVRARKRMVVEARAAAEKEDEKGKTLGQIGKAASLVRARTFRGFATILDSFMTDVIEGIIARSMLTALLGNRRIAPAFAFLETGGFLLGQEFVSWLGEKLKAKGVMPSDTLGMLHEKKGKETGRELSIIASDTTDSEMLVLNHRTAPECPVVQAVRMSMSIPFVFREVVWDKTWGTYLGRKKEGNIIVDGGMLSNFPIGLLQRPPALPEVLLKDVRDASNKAAARVEVARRIMGDLPQDPGQVSVLGLLIDESQQVPKAPEPPRHPELFRRSIDRTNRIVNTVTGTWDDAAVQQFKDRICRLPAKGYGVLEFGMEDPRLDPLLEAAKNAMTAFLTKD